MFLKPAHHIDTQFLKWPTQMDPARFPSQELDDVVTRARAADFYRTRLPKASHSDYASWKRLPLTTKNDLRQGYPLGFLAEPLHRVASYHESSGTSGQPTATLFTENDWDDIVTRFTRSRVRLSAHDVVFIKTPYSLVTTAHQMERAARLVGATVIPADNRSRNMPYAKVVRLLKTLPVTVAWCLPTEALIWAVAARAVGLDPAGDFPQLRAFFVAGEPLSEAKRRRISDLWGGIDVIQDYGSTETGSLAGECPAGKLHFWADRVFPEVIDRESGIARLEGEGSLVVTPLFREAMPLVRYHVEDVVRLSYGPCACGWNLPTVQVLGRSVDLGAEVVSPHALEDVVYDLPACYDVQFWRARRTETGFKLEIAASGDLMLAASDELACLIYKRLGVKAEVEAVPTSAFIPDHLLTVEPGFQKPRFVFGPEEDWSGSLIYG